MTEENKQAGRGAIAAAALGLLAVVAIIVLANREQPRVNAGSSAELSRVARGSTSPSVPTDHEAGDDIALDLAPLTADAGAAAMGADLGHVGPEAGVAGASEPGPDPAWITPTGVSVSAISAEPPPAPARPDLTPEQRYEAHAFLTDLIVLRIDTLRTEIAAARAAGDERALRRLEPALSVLEEEVTELHARQRELGRELRREGGAAETEAPPAER